MINNIPDLLRIRLTDLSICYYYKYYILIFALSSSFLYIIIFRLRVYITDDIFIINIGFFYIIYVSYDYILKSLIVS